MTNAIARRSEYCGDNSGRPRARRSGSRSRRGSRIVRPSANAGLDYVLPPKCPQMNGAVERCNGTWCFEFYAV